MIAMAWGLNRAVGMMLFGNGVRRRPRIAGGRIVDLIVRAGGQPVAQIAGALLGRGHGCDDRAALRLPVQLRIAEEEELVLDDRPPIDPPNWLCR